MSTKQTTQHTPGPWELKAGRCFKTPSGEFYLTYGKDRYNNPYWKASFSELDDIARLIAAAPRMLEFIRWAAASPAEGCECKRANEGCSYCLATDARAILRDVEG